MKNTVVSLHIVPKSAKSEIVGWISDVNGLPVLKIKVAAPPEDGKANRELIKFLSKQWGIPSKQMEITAGEQSRHKRLTVKGNPPLPPVTKA